jgi:hypothetical protein
MDEPPKMVQINRLSYANAFVRAIFLRDRLKDSSWNEQLSIIFSPVKGKVLDQGPNWN